MVPRAVDRSAEPMLTTSVLLPLCLASMAACGSGTTGSTESGNPETADGAALDQIAVAVPRDGTGSTPPLGDGGPKDSSPMFPADGRPNDSAASTDGIDSVDAPPAMAVDSGPLDPNEGPLPRTSAMVFPAPGAQGVCPDPPLRITFASPPTLGSSGSIQVHDDTGAVVSTVDMGASMYTDTIGGVTFNLLRPVYVDGNDIVIYLMAHALGYGKTYSVTVDPGAILAPGGASVTVGDSTTWRFSTTTAVPTNLSALTVATNASGDFCSIQGALDAIPVGGAATTVTLEPGLYHEIIHATSLSNVTLHGADRKGTVVVATNNNNMNPTTMTRSLVGIDNSSSLVIENLTIQNSTPQGGSQAESLRLQNCDKCIVRNADIISLQDTLLWSGRIYAENCYVAGNVDFVWGTGAAYFKNCEIRTLGRAGAIVQARNGASGYGYVFVDSKLTSDSTVSGQLLGRIDVGAYPASHVAFVNCTMGSFIAPAGWAITGLGGTSQLRFWEYQSVDESGNAADTSQRIAGSTQISSAQAMSMRDTSVVLSGWIP